MICRMAGLPGKEEAKGCMVGENGVSGFNWGLECSKEKASGKHVLLS